MIAIAVALLIGLAALVIVARADIDHTLTLSWARNGEPISQTVTVSAEGETNANVTVPNATTDKRLKIAIDVSEVKLLYIHSTQAVTIETNSASSPADTLTLAANKPLLWYVGCGWALPLTTDVADFFITNAGGTAADVKVRVLEDTTP